MLCYINEYFLKTHCPVLHLYVILLPLVFSTKEQVCLVSLLPVHNTGGEFPYIFPAPVMWYDGHPPRWHHLLQQIEFYLGFLPVSHDWIWCLIKGPCSYSLAWGAPFPNLVAATIAPGYHLTTWSPEEKGLGPGTRKGRQNYRDHWRRAPSSPCKLPTLSVRAFPDSPKVKKMT